MQLVRHERTSKLGRLGELLAAERLQLHGFEDVANLNQQQTNFPFADLLASKDGVSYLIGVKARNRMRQGNAGLNASYNLVLIAKAAKAELERQGKSRQEITALLLAEVNRLAINKEAVPAWVAVSIQAEAGTYSAYFGLVEDIGLRRSVPMTPKACSTYLCLAEDIADSRITLDLLNS